MTLSASASARLTEHDALVSSVRSAQQKHRRWLASLSTPPQDLLNLPVIPATPARALPADAAATSPRTRAEPPARPIRPDLPPAKKARVERYRNYVAEEETIRNDYSQRHVDSGEYPQNWVLGAEPERRFEEYPKQQRLLALKKEAVASTASTPYYAPLSSLVRGEMAPAKFDVILLDPPYSSSFTFDTLSQLPIPSLAADPSFVFLWVGSGAGEALERGREVLAKWGYRRCEDIVWVKTNKTTNRGPGSEPPTSSLLTRTKQHCLMGIRGTVRRSTDSWFVHCNVDTDVIVWEGDPADPTRKPPEMYTLIENFCLGLRRLEVFGRSHSIRPGWLTVGDAAELEQNDLGAQPWSRETWEAELNKSNGKFVVPMTAEIDALRPKSPVRNNPPQHMQGGPNPGMGMGMGPGGMNMGPGGMNMGPMGNMGMNMGMMGGPMGGMGMGGPPPTMNVPLRFDASGGLNVALPPPNMGMGPMMGGGAPGMLGMPNMKNPGMGAMGGMGGPGNMNRGGPGPGFGGGMGMGGGMGPMGGHMGMGGMGMPGGNMMGGPRMGGGMGMGFPPNMGGGDGSQMWDPSQQMGMDQMGMNMNVNMGGEWY